MTVLSRIADGLISISHGRELLSLFLDHGESISKMDSNGYNVLHQAVLLGVVSAVLLLLEYGADISALSSSGKSTFQIATEKYERSRKEDRFALMTARRLKTVMHLLEPESKSREILEGKHKKEEKSKGKGKLANRSRGRSIESMSAIVYCNDVKSTIWFQVKMLRPDLLAKNTKIHHGHR